MSNLKILSVALLSLAAGGLCAEDAPWLFTGNNTAGTEDLTAAKWSNDGGTTKEAPQAGRSYSVTGTRQCGYALTNGDLTFAGDVLSVGDGSSASRLVGSGSLASSTKKVMTWTFPSLVFAKNGGFSVMYNNGTLTLAGAITIAGDDVRIYDNGGYGTALNIAATLDGAGDFRIFKNKSNSNIVSYRLQGDASAYTGTMTVGKDQSRVATYLTRAFLGDTAPRKVAVSPCGVLCTCGAEDYLGLAELDSLTLAADATLGIKVTAATNTLFRVKDTLTLPGDGKVRLDLMLPAENAAVRRVPILSAPTEAGLSKDRFVLVASSNADACRSAACSLEVEPDGEDNDVLYLVMEKYTYAVKQDAYGESCWLKDYFNHWKTAPAGDTLDADTVYLAYDKQPSSPPSNKTQTFAGKRWVFCSGNSKLKFYLGDFTIDDLVLLDGTKLETSAYNLMLRGKIRLGTPQGGEWGAEVNGFDGNSGTIESDISGEGGLSFIGGSKGYTFKLVGCNSGLSGKLKISTNANNPATSMTIVATNACALGGAMAQFTYDGVMLEKWSKLRVTDSMTFGESTRGLFVSGAAIVEVQNAADTFTLASQTTLAGELAKQGAGTLALGGTLKFTTDQLAEPLEGTNVLTVSAGRIRPASKDGANGLAIAFAAGTGLRFAPLAETDADVTKYGLYDVAWPTPFDLTATDGKLDVAVDVPEGTKDSFSFGICTVTEDAADALDGNIVIPEIKGLKASVVREPAVDGAVTFRADYERRGLMLIFR